MSQEIQRPKNRHKQQNRMVSACDHEMDSSSRYRAGDPVFTASKYPHGPGLEKSLWLPFGVVYTPLETPGNEASSQNVPICRMCLSYASMYSEINGTKWTCSLCNCENIAESTEQLQAIACNTLEHRQRLPNEVSRNLLTKQTLIAVIDSNLPVMEARGVGKAFENVIRDSEGCEMQVGLVVFNSLVSVYHLEAPGNMAVADVFEDPSDMTEAMIASRPYLANPHEAIETLWQCLRAVFGLAIDGDGENQAAKPLSRLELLKKRKEQRLRQQQVGASNLPKQASKSPWLLAKEERAKQPAVRSTAEALQIGIDLVPKDSQGRIMLFTNGCPSKGEASLVDQTNQYQVSPLRVTIVSEYLEVLGKVAIEDAHSAIDVFLSGSGELGMPVFASLCEPSAGYALVHESFASPQLSDNLKFISQRTKLTPPLSKGAREELDNAIPEGCSVDIRMSK